MLDSIENIFKPLDVLASVDFVGALFEKPNGN